jgi:hypothetical protein
LGFFGRARSFDAATGAAMDGAKIAGITVRFSDSGGARLGLVRRDATRLVFGPLRSGIYDVTLSAPGYAPATRAQVVVTPGSVAELSVSLELEKR